MKNAPQSVPEEHRDNAPDWWDASRRVFKHFAWLDDDSDKMTLRKPLGGSGKVIDLPFLD